MKQFPTRMLPQRIVLQIMLVMLTAIVAMILLTIAIFSITQPKAPNAGLLNGLIRTTIAVTRLNEEALDEKTALLGEIQAAQPDLKLTLLGKDALIPTQSDEPPHFWPFRPGELGFGLRLVAAMPKEMAAGREPTPVLYFRFQDGSFASAELQPHPMPPIFGDPMFLMLVFAGISIVLLFLWVTRTLVRPLSDLAVAVSSFGRDSATPVPIDETGPMEVREAARAFNRMQQRIRELIDRRTRMLAAIGHDLKTPITRMRLRVDLLPEGVQKQRYLADLDLMETQLNGAMSFLREGRTGEATSKVNLPSMLQGISDLYEDMGVSLSLACEPRLTVEGRPSELHRALSNLIDNARRYDERIGLRAGSVGEHILIDVIDHGPGIAQEDRARLLQPFERGDEARQLHQGGSFGLGLATTSAIAQAHGGTFELLDTEGGGLTARITLPKA